MGSHIRVPAPDLTRFACLRVQVAPSTLRLSSQSAVHSASGGGQGGTRNRSTSRNVQTWSVRPAAMAGGRGRQHLAEPWPWVGSGCGHGKRKEACGKQKLS